MALKVKEDEFVVLCVHAPGESVEDLAIIKVSLDGKEFFNIPLDKQHIKFHKEVLVSYI